MPFETNIFKARADRIEARRVYRAELAKFATEMEGLRTSGAIVRVTGFPTDSITEIEGTDGSVNRIPARCAQLKDDENSDPRPWIISGEVVEVTLKRDDLDIDVKPVGGNVTITFPVSGLSELEVLGEA